MPYSRSLLWPLYISVSLMFQTAITINAGPLTDTGQATSYTDTFGEDSDYLIDPPSYTKLAYGGVELPDTATFEDGWVMTRDNVTGLIWEVKTNKDNVPDYENSRDADNTYTWYDSHSETNGGDAGTPSDGTDTEDFIDSLNSENFGGFTDWRIPDREELRSIVDHDSNSPAINTAYFPYTSTWMYWSSTTDANTAVNAWAIIFNMCGDIADTKSTDFHVRAVRGGQSDPSNSLIANGDGTVTDISVGLMWQQVSELDPMNFETALAYCESLPLGEYTDWRLPNIKELESLVDLSRVDPSINTTNFPGTGSHQYLSSTSGAFFNYNANAWIVHFGNGCNGYSSKWNLYKIRAVRGGQNQIESHLFITTPNQADVLKVGDTVSVTWVTQSISGNVSITLSRNGGKTFDEVISPLTPNDGSFEWVISGNGSYNCVLKIIPLSDTDKSTTQGLFTIGSPNAKQYAMPYLPLLLLGE